MEQAMRHPVKKVGFDIVRLGPATWGKMSDSAGETAVQYSQERIGMEGQQFYQQLLDLKRKER
jgi:hypothetical protein